jgi:hypothetical protein
MKTILPQRYAVAIILAACALCGANAEGGIFLSCTAERSGFSEPAQSVLAKAATETGLPREGAAASIPSADEQTAENPRASGSTPNNGRSDLTWLLPDSGARSGGASAPSRGADDTSSGFAAPAAARLAICVRADFRLRRGQSLRWSNPTPNEMLDPPKPSF